MVFVSYTIKHIINRAFYTLMEITMCVALNPHRQTFSFNEDAKTLNNTLAPENMLHIYPMLIG